MALQNAFEDLALDSTIIESNEKLDDIIAALKLNASLTKVQPISIDSNSIIVSLLIKLIEEQKVTNKILTKLYQ